MSDFHRRLGRRIAAARKHAGLSQRELGRAIGYDQTMLSHVETGRSGMTLPHLARTAGALKVSADYVLGPDTPEGAGPATPIETLQSLGILKAWVSGSGQKARISRRLQDGSSTTITANLQLEQTPELTPP